MDRDLETRKKCSEGAQKAFKETPDVWKGCCLNNEYGAELSDEYGAKLRSLFAYSLFNSAINW